MTLGAAIQHGSVVLGKYRVEAILGRGGMGIVVQARHLALDELVAIKLLRDDVLVDDETRARFVREAQAAAKLKSEHVARIRDVGTFDDDKPYMVMEFLEGQDLGELLRERGKLHPSLAIDLVIQTCDALAEAHALGIVHRDIKPTNLFLTSHPDGSMLLKVLDFGISKATNGTDLSLTQTASMLGTPAYMSPEQMRSARRVDARTDIWSLGLVLYEALEGHLPFQAESFSEMCVMVAADPPAPMVAAAPPLVPIVARCLAKQPDQRYQNVAELARDLAVHAREPHKAQMVVDRMFRVLGRARMTPAPVQTPPLGVYATPIPMPIRDSAPVVTASSPTIATIAGSHSHSHSHSHSLSLSQVRLRPRRGVALALLAAAAAIAAVIAVVVVTRDDASSGPTASAPPATTESSKSAPPLAAGSGDSTPPGAAESGKATPPGAVESGQSTPNVAAGSGDSTPPVPAESGKTTPNVAAGPGKATPNVDAEPGKAPPPHATDRASATPARPPHAPTAAPARAPTQAPPSPPRRTPTAPKRGAAPPTNAASGSQPPAETVHTVPAAGSDAPKPDAKTDPTPACSDPFSNRRGC